TTLLSNRRDDPLQAVREEQRTSTHPVRPRQLQHHLRGDLRRHPAQQHRHGGHLTLTLYHGRDQCAAHRPSTLPDRPRAEPAGSGRIWPLRCSSLMLISPFSTMACPAASTSPI